jgi:hypothetical protein
VTVRLRDAGLAVLLAALAWSAPALALRSGRPLVVNLGPNDADYVRGFREDWERLGRTRFHWTTLSSSVRLPARLSGEGHLLRMRGRRHFVEPALVALSVEGRAAAAPLSIAADTRVAYRILEVPLPRLVGREPFELRMDAHSENPRPLGVAIDWIEVEPRGPSARVLPLPRMRLSLLAVVLAAFLATRLAGGGRALAGGHALIVLAAAAAGSAWDFVAADRIVRHGAAPYVAMAALGVLLARWGPARRALALEGSRAGTVLVVAMLLALAVRLVLLLNPQFFYPDVRVHANMAWQLHRRGLVDFLREFTVSQYRFSLGLQFENGHWYAFPYPPAFYLLCWPLLALGWRPEIVVSVLGAAANSVEVFLVYAIGRRLRLPHAVSLAGSLAAPLLPLFLARLTLAYFPALLGHAIDAALILYLVAHLDDHDRPRVWLTLGVALALALLAYTQALLNFAILLPSFLLLQIAFDRAPAARRRQAGLVAAGAIGVVLAMAIFYARYVPTFLDMQRGIPQPEERVLLEKFARAPATAADEPAEEEPDDPYAGPGVNPLRGVRKAAWRLYVFYGAFSAAVLAGLWLISRMVTGAAARFVAAWAALYLLLNLASGGLPGPNLVRYNKDLEIVAPLFCLALGAVAARLWTLAATWSRIAAIAYGAAFWAFGASRAVRYLTEKFVMER